MFRSPAPAPSTKHCAPTSVEVLLLGKLLPQGGGATALLLLWRPGSLGILEACCRGHRLRPHIGAAALGPEGVKAESRGRRPEPRRLAPPPSIPAQALILGCKDEKAWLQSPASVDI